MNPINSDIFGRLDWLTKKIKNVFGRLTKIEQSGAGSYKVYSALITQQGEPHDSYYVEGPLTIGVTYSITDGINGDDDFTNVGAPAGETNPTFVATGTTPNKWTNGTRTYYNTGAPIVVTALENTIGNIWFTYKNVGVYNIESNNLFTEGKTIPSFENIFSNGWEKNVWENMEESNSSAIRILSWNTSIPGKEDYLDLCKIEIRVYN